MRRGKKSLMYGINLKSIYRKPHFSTKKMLEVQKKEEDSKLRKKYELD